MPKLSRFEIDEALEEYRQAEQAINQADPEFVESAVYRHKAAESRVDALISQARQDNVVPFPMTRCEPKEEAEQSWHEFVFDLMEWPLAISVGLLAIIVIMVQFGLWLGWFR